jgi:RND family efflux transporter MFP subunit
LQFLLQKQNRLKNISTPNLISKEDLDDLDLNVEKLKLSIANDKIKLKELKLDCGHCLIRAPIKGRIGKIHAQVGQWVSEGDKPLTTIDKIDQLIVEFNLSEDELLKLDRRPIPFTVVSLAQQQHFCTAYCSFIDHQVDSKTGSIKLEGTISNTAKKFRKNQIIKVLIESQLYKEAITIPRKAVKMNEEGTYVYRISPNDEAESVHVIIEDELDDLAIVQVGLEAGDEVVTEGHLRLHPGAKIKRKVDVK